MASTAQLPAAQEKQRGRTLAIKSSTIVASCRCGRELISGNTVGSQQRRDSSKSTARYMYSVDIHVVAFHYKSIKESKHQNQNKPV
jgi:hypothetical protein